MPTSSKKATSTTSSSRQLFRKSVNCNTVESYIDLQATPSSPQSISQPHGSLINYDTASSTLGNNLNLKIHDTSENETKERILECENFLQGNFKKLARSHTLN
jgi:hypothetical protein